MSQSVWMINDIDLIVRLVLAVLLGGLVGIEREISNHSAGFRTHILVCLGSTMIMLLSIYGFSDFVNEYNVRMDPARLAAQVISGIGFLGAGAIMRNGNIITGLTTAASLWVVAAIGLCVGAGFYKAATICTALVITTLFILNKCEQFLTRKRRIKKIEIFASKQSMAIAQVLSIMEGQQLKVLNLSIVSDETQNSVADNKIHNMKICVTCKLPKHTSWLSVLEQLEQVESVRSINVVGKEYKIGDINSSFTSAG